MYILKPEMGFGILTEARKGVYILNTGMVCILRPEWGGVYIAMLYTEVIYWLWFIYTGQKGGVGYNTDDKDGRWLLIVLDQ